MITCPVPVTDCPCNKGLSISRQDIVACNNCTSGWQICQQKGSQEAFICCMCTVASLTTLDALAVQHNRLFDRRAGAATWQRKRNGTSLQHRMASADVTPHQIGFQESCPLIFLPEAQAALP